MNEPVISRDSICRDADKAAQRFIESGAEQPNPHLEGTEAHAVWQAAYRRLCDYYRDPLAEGGC